jgi:hypothetical protein
MTRATVSGTRMRAPVASVMSRAQETDTGPIDKRPAMIIKTVRCILRL